ncbi:MAG: undecaprenyl-phosphate glucose phosphotransferase [Rhodobiaceae bacterium]|nr:undecaprenyl-phosphate glucose phosphotransferase [Rhodobiaceae bacterium]MCC0047815.1 undecaprenyl-phosphate glucose phosphotransferase [Rhodobiaceae bacterium]
MLNVSRGWTVRASAAMALSVASEAFLVACASVLAHLVYHITAYHETGSLSRLGIYALLAGLSYALVVLMRGDHDSHFGMGKRVDTPDIFLIWNTAFVITLFILFISKTLEDHSRGAILLSYVFGLAGAVGARLAISTAATRAAFHGLISPRRVLVIGLAGEINRFVSAQLSGNRGLSVIDAIRIAEAEEPAPDLGIIVSVAVERARELNPDDIVITIPLRQAETIERIVDAMVNVPANLYIAQDGLLERFRDIGTGHIGDVAGVVLSRQRLTPFDQAMKRTFDAVVAATALVLLTPLLIAIGIAIRLESRGPALFTQTRYGFNEEPFRIIKFRTMTTQDDGADVKQATRNDKRITRLGRFLRRSSIDELPQLINVLYGEMSLVGPRPHAVAHNRYYEQRVVRYARRHNVKPGITGWAQVNGLRGETDTDDKMAKRVAYDLYYLDNWSFGFDLRIIALTVLTILGSRNAY